jgi:phage protein D
VAEPELNQPLVPSFDIAINGKPLAAAELVYVTGILVDDGADLPSMFALDLASADTQKKGASWVDDERFNLGAEVEIKFGYGSKQESLIVGEVTGIEPEYEFNRLPSVIVRGFDRRHRLMRGRKSTTFLKQKDSEIATQLAKAAGLSVEATDSKVTHEHVYQNNQTDWEFLRTRAARINYELAMDGKRLLFRPRANDVGEAFTLTFRENLLEFNARLSSVNQIDEVKIQGWDVKEKKAIVSLSKAGEEGSRMGGQESGGKLANKAFGKATQQFDTLPIATQSEADQIAKAQLNERALNFITGEGVCYGRTKLRAGIVIKIAGLDRRFNGLYYVTGAAHRYSQVQGYQTHFRVRRNAS